MPTAAVIVIGNEILSGKFADENGPYLITRFRQLGCDLMRIVVIADDVQVIADEVRECSRRFDHVITSGGVGPTHDDVTLDGVAAAFGVPLVRVDELAALIDKYGLPRNESTLRMAMAPLGAELLRGDALYFPVMAMRNVVVMPGVPKLLRMKFEAIAQRFAGDAVVSARVYTDEQEWDIAERLTAVAARFPTVAIGSYPRFGEGNFKVILTLESRDAAGLVAAELAIREVIRAIEPKHDES